MDFTPVKRALISVSDKTNLNMLGTCLAERSVTVLSTGGTAKALRESNLTVVDVAEVTGFPEMMDGRVKTLHPAIHGGLLALRDNADHMAAMDEHAIGAIDLLVVNLYPFEEALLRGADYDEMVENIDIGGPAMIRAAAKNHKHVCTIVDPEDYPLLVEELATNNGATSLAFRQKMAAKAYARTASYDAAVAGWMQGHHDGPAHRVTIAGTLLQTMRYGENPHQKAAFYSDATLRPGVATAKQHQGKDLSYNNINDTDAAFELISEFADADTPACAIIKHANPCGVAQGASLCEAYEKAFACDTTSAFGGIVALNHPLDAQTAKKITEIFTEVVIAPGASEEALAIFALKKNLRLLTTDRLPNPEEAIKTIRQVSGGYLVQDKDVAHVRPQQMRVVTKRQPSDDEMADLLFAWRVAKHVKSNAIVYAKNRATVGIGAGQMSRLDSALIAATKARRMAETLNLAETPAKGAVVASDAFFPFADGLLEAANAGATAAIQPGGSLNDADVIKAADDAGLAMVLTGVRHFRH